MNFSGPNKELAERIESLEGHLREEHPALLEVVPTYRKFDNILYKMGLLGESDSLVTRITWWPLISVLGTFSAGKSTFINHYLGEKLQSTGNQAVDDKFSVICFGRDKDSRVLPGSALDADPRFPFYRMSKEIEKVAFGEGGRIDAYLQLKTASSDGVKGKTIIDSPGFDADEKRNSILRLTDHIIDISDLVLVFFDARHPEPGAMRDTLQHLVAATIKRTDSGKFLYILNQIDCTAREDNPEEVIAAWQRALSQAGLNSGRFYCTYNSEAAYPIADAALRERYERKRDEDLGEIRRRMGEVEIERGYRIIKALETSVNELESDVVPRLERSLDAWQRATMFGDVVLLAAAVAAVYFLAPEKAAAVWQWVSTHAIGVPISVIMGGLIAFTGHFWVRDVMARIIGGRLPARFGPLGLNIRQAFKRNTRIFRSILRTNPVGWGRGARKQAEEVRDGAARHVQRLNDLFTNPSGRGETSPSAVAVGLVADSVPQSGDGASA